ncbi:MAG: potassium transporter [Leptospira sp.]|nr:MAG: potassium transporter [Leptospira sp.]
MESNSIFIQTIIYLGASIIMVPIAHRLGLGSVLGYLLAGIGIGPAFLGLVGTESVDMLHFAEFGVVMMLFVIGLELELPLLWKLKNWLLGLGGLQVFGTSLFFFLLAKFLGLEVKPAIAMGLILSLSSTAIVLQTLQEKGLMKTPSGQGAFSVLLFQDMAVIPILAIFPLLVSSSQSSSSSDDHGSSLISDFPAYVQTFIVFAVIVGIILMGRYVLNPLFRFIASTELREVFTAASLLLVIGISLLMGLVGLSAALGTFLAGVVLASSEFRHELESNLAPFKGLLLGLFFLSVGSTLNVQIVLNSPIRIFTIVAGIMIGKTLLLLILGKIFKLPIDQNLYFALSLSQVGEFSFVLFNFSASSGIFTKDLVSTMVASVAISMALTPLLLLVYEKLVLPRFSHKTSMNLREQDKIENEDNPVIIAGFGKFGNMVGRFLRSNDIHCTVLDYDVDRVELLRTFGFKVYFGDATREDLLESAGAKKAKILIASLDSFEKQKELISCARKHFPHLKILARAGDREEAYDLKDLSADQIYRETRDTAIELGKSTLENLGYFPYQAHKAAQMFLKHDEDTFQELYEHRKDRKTYVSLAKQRTAELKRLMTFDDTGETKDQEEIW